MVSFVPSVIQRRHRPVHDLMGRHCIVTDKPHDSEYRRIRVQHWVPGLAVGHLIRWNPKMTVDSIAYYLVLTNEPHPGRRGVWLAEIGRLVPDVTIGGATYAAPSQGFLMAVPEGELGRFV